MSYFNAYKQISSLAEQIREGTYQGSKPKITESPLKGLAARESVLSDEPDEELEEAFDQAYMAKVMADLREQNKEIFSGSGEDYTIEGDLGSALYALGQVESGGNYQARGPVVEKGMYKGQRAAGKYQVMPGNIPQWSKEALGREISLEEFLDNPEYQERIAAHQMQKSFDQYGSWQDAASVWFSGRPLKGNTSDDGFKTVPEYVKKFNRYLREA